MAAFDTAAAATVRKPRGRVTVYWSGFPLDSLIIDTPATNRNTIHDRVAFLLPQAADEITGAGAKYMELGTSVGLETVALAPSTRSEALNNQFGFWGADLSDGSGDFSTAQRLAVKFPPRPVTSLTVAGDDEWGQYPVDFTIAIYSDNGATLKKTYTVTGNSANPYTLSGIVDGSGDQIADAEIIVLSVTKWSAADTVLKITEFYSGFAESYDGDEIMELSIFEESEIKDASIPTGNISANEVELALNNVDDKFFPGNTDSLFNQVILQGRRIVAEIGFVLPDGTAEYKPMGTFWSGDWELSESGTTASTRGLDRMGRLQDMEYAPTQLWERQSVGFVVQQVLEDARIKMPDLEYEIESVLYGEDYTIPVAFFKKQTYFDALKILSTACVGRCYVDRDDVIQFKSVVSPGAFEYEITADNYFNRTLPENIKDVANVISVTTQPLKEELLADIYTSSEELELVTGEQRVVEVEYNSAPCRAELYSLEASEDTPDFAGTITGTDYSWGSTVTVTCTTAGKCKIKITGSKWTVDGAEVVNTRDEQSILYYGERLLELGDNPLIQTRALADIITQGLVSVYKEPAKDAQLDWRGNPSIALDTVIRLPRYVKNGISDKADYVVYSSKLTYDGGLSGELTARRIRDATPTVFIDTDGAEAVVVSDSGVADFIDTDTED
jgi:hypothetical protein